MLIINFQDEFLCLLYLNCSVRGLMIYDMECEFCSQIRISLFQSLLRFLECDLWLYQLYTKSFGNSL